MQGTGRRIKTLLVGMGQMGRHHFRVLSEDARFELIGVVDPVLAQLPRVDVPLYRQLAETSSFDYDLAVVAAPTELHFELVKTLLLQKRHVFVEKPAASSAAAAQQLVTLAREQGRHLAVGNIERCNPVVAALQKVIESGVLGAPVHLQGIRAGSYPARVKEGNDVILDLAVHELDVFRLLLGPLTIMQSYGHAARQSGIVDTAEISVRNAAGVTGQIHVSWLSPERQRRIQLTALQGLAHLDYIGQTLKLVSSSLPHDPQGFDWQLDAQGMARAEVQIATQETLKVQLDQLYRLLQGEKHQLATEEQLIESVSLIEESLARVQSHI